MLLLVSLQLTIPGFRVELRRVDVGEDHDDSKHVGDID